MTKVLPRIEEFPKDGRIWRVSWFGGIERNSSVPTEPKMQVMICPLKDGTKDYSYAAAGNEAERQVIEIGVGQLPLLTVGSLWRDGGRMAEVAGKTREFPAVSISPDTVQLVRSDTQVDGDYLIRPLYHRIGSGLAANCLAVSWQGDPYGLLIPVQEIIRFYYATSSDLSKGLFTGALSHDLDHVINEEKSRFDPATQRCYLTLRKYYSDHEAWVIARLFCYPDALASARRIYGAMMERRLQGKPWGYPEAAFPFVGETNLRARVKPMQTADKQHWRYIVFELEYCTGPFPFATLMCHRDNSNRKAPVDTDLPQDQKKPSFSVKAAPDEPLDSQILQSHDEPSKQSDSVEIAIPLERFGALAGMKMEHPEKEMCHYFNAGMVKLPGMGLKSGLLGTGDGTYGEREVVPAQIVGEMTRPAALPVTFELFQEVIGLLNQYPDCAAEIRPRTKAIYCIPLTKAAGKRQWSYLDSSRRIPRQVVIGDLNRGDQTVSLVEFERRQGESFRLAILQGEQGTKLTNLTLRHVLVRLAEQQGRWENLGNELEDVKVALLKHTYSKLQAWALAILAKAKL